MLAPMAGAGVFTAVVGSTAGFTAAADSAAAVDSTAARFMPARSMAADFMVADFTPEGTDASRASIMVLVTGAAATGTMDGAEGATDGGGVMAWDGLIIRTDRITMATTTLANPPKPGITVRTQRATTPT
jgi:hypothetical protein